MTTTYCEDSYAVMNRYEDNFFDISFHDGNAFIVDGELKNDEEIKERYFRELWRVSKYQVVFGYTRHHRVLPDPPGQVYGLLIHDAGKEFIRTHPAHNQCNIIYTTFPTPIVIYEAAYEEKKIIPSQKPYKLYSFIIREFGGLIDIKRPLKIFESSTGAGMLRRACYDIGYEYVGCEIDKERFNKHETAFNKYVKEKKWQ